MLSRDALELGQRRNFPMKTKWFKFVNGGKGSRQTHAHLKTDAHGEIEFQCGLQRHMDDTILAPISIKKCPSCLNYLKGFKHA